MQIVEAFDKLLSEDELQVVRGLTSPARIQAFLDGIPYSTDPIYRCPLRVLRDRRAHCFDGALFAAAALRRLGHAPLVIDLLPDGRDDEHLLALYKRDGFWGAVAKSNCVGLRYREPIYRTLRELVMSYFEFYFNVEYEKTLRGYTLPLNLTAFDRYHWMTSDDHLEAIAKRLERVRKVNLLTPGMVAGLSRVDERTYQGGLLGADDAGLYKPARTRAVIFDLFGTLVPAFPPELFARSLAGMADAAGLAREAFHRLWVRDTANARMTGVFPTIEANIEHIARALGADPSPAQLAEAARIRMAFYRETLVARPDAEATLRALKARGLRLGLISDCSCEAPLLWPETPFAALIDAPVFSCSEGVRKPDPRIYRRACERLGVAPEECIYVGDGASQELTGASALGMRAVLIAVPGEVSPDQAEKEAATWRGARISALPEVLELAH